MRWRQRSHPSASQVLGELGLPASPQQLTESSWKREFCCPNLVVLQQELGVAAIHPRNPTVPQTIRMHALSCLPLFFSPSMSLCHPKDASTWHSLQPGCHLA